MKNINKKIISAVMATTLTAGMFTACKDNSDNKKRNKNNGNETEVTVPDLQELPPVKRQPVTGNVDVDTQPYVNFSVELLRNTYEGNNVMVSPLSVMGALGMTMNGADGQTLSEMEEMFGLSVEEVNYLMYNFDEFSSGMELTQANSIFLNSINGYEPQAEFRQNIVDYYNSDIKVGPFNEDMVDIINDFVDVSTKHRIGRIINKLDEDDELVLVNALAFDGKWRSPFESERTYDRSFFLEDGSEITVSMMGSEEYSAYIEGDNETGFIKYYQGDYAYIALLPDESLTMDEYISSLTGEEIADLINYDCTEDVIIRVPVYESEYSKSLVTCLMNMGMVSAFNNSADFSRMLLAGDEPADIMISDVIHKTYISVNEEGTEAAAATAVIMEDKCAEMDERTYKYVTLDRPFVYMVVNTATGLPVFMGVYNGVEQA